MIRLTLTGERSRAPTIIESPYFRITGGAVWTQPGSNPLVRHIGPTWLSGGVHWTGMRFDGNCRLVFGLPRDPAGVSGLLSIVSICACILSANGAPFAVYEPEREMWHGAQGDRWWHSFRLESLTLRPIPTKPSARENSVFVVVPDPLHPGTRSTQ